MNTSTQYFRHLNEKAIRSSVHSSDDPESCDRSSAQLRQFHRIFPDRERVDHRILTCTLMLQENIAGPVALVTKDLNMQLKARAVGIKCEGHMLKPLNLGQKCLLDALLNPDISLITCFGQAGTGKTLVAMAAGLHLVFNREMNGLTVSRPVVAMGDQLGYLPSILDEAQQLTPQEAKTVVTRMSRGSKLVMVGDPAQIDNPYVDSRSNGLVYTRKKMKGQAFAAHVSLTRGERSPLAEAGAQFM